MCENLFPVCLLIQPRARLPVSFRIDTSEIWVKPLPRPREGSHVKGGAYPSDFTWRHTTLNEQTEFFNIMCSSSTLRDNLADEVVLFCLDQPK